MSTNDRERLDPSNQAAEENGTALSHMDQVKAGSPAASLPNSPEPNRLSPEEQMALFENDLKENDWGHQPC